MVVQNTLDIAVDAEHEPWFIMVDVDGTAIVTLVKNEKHYKAEINFQITKQLATIANTTRATNELITIAKLIVKEKSEDEKEIKERKIETIERNKVKKTKGERIAAAPMVFADFDCVSDYNLDY